MAVFFKIWLKLVPGPTLPELFMPNRHTRTERLIATETQRRIFRSLNRTLWSFGVGFEELLVKQSTNQKSKHRDKRIQD